MGLSGATTPQGVDWITVLMWSQISDVADKQSFDSLVAEYMGNYEEAAADAFDILTRNEITGGTTIQYASTATARTGVGSGMRLNLAEVREAVTTLKRNDAKPVVDNKFICILHPDSATDMFSDSNVVNAFQYAQNRGGDNALFTGVLGDLHGVRFIETTNARIRSSLGLSGANIYQTILFGREAFGVIDYASMGMQVLQEGPGGVTDPLRQHRTIGYKFSHAAAILNQNFLVSIEHTTSRHNAA